MIEMHGTGVKIKKNKIKNKDFYNVLYSQYVEVYQPSCSVNLAAKCYL